MNITAVRNDAHVVPSRGLWAVKMESAEFVSGYFRTKVEATALAIDLARHAASSVVVHGRDGVIQTVWNYDAYKGVDLLERIA